MRSRLARRIGSGLLPLIILGTLGCGVGGSEAGPPIANVVHTQHPLVANYNVEEYGLANVWVEFGTDTNYGRRTSSVSSATVHSNSVDVLVAGMKASTTYHMRAHVDYVDGTSWVDQDQSFKTGGLPSYNHLGLTVTRPNPDLDSKQDGVELLDVTALGTGNLGASVVDRDGNIIWYYDFGPASETWAFPIKLLPNGHVLINASSQGSDNLMEVDLTGNVVRSLSVSSLNQKLQEAGFSITVLGVHHDVLILPNGHWILICNLTQPFTNLPGYPGTTLVYGDALVDLDPDWNAVWVWSSFDHLDVKRHPFGLPDWTHSNALVYTKNDGNLLLSMRDQSWILKINYADGTGAGDILWRLGDGGDFSLAGGDPSQWFYGQHFPYVDGINGSQLTLAIFDDGDQRLSISGVPCGVVPCFSRAVILQVDEATKNASVQWQYLPGYYTFWGGSIGVLDNGDVEFDGSQPFGPTVTGSRVMEVTQTDSPQVVWQMDISGGNAYRAYRVPSLYPGIVWP